MTEQQPRGRFGYVYAASVGVGILTVVVGNAMIALNNSPSGLAAGQAVRSLGMLIAILVGVVFVTSSFMSRRRNLARRPNVDAIETGPSDLLVLGIRIVCALSMVFVLSQAVMTFAMLGFGFNGWYTFTFTVFTAAALLVPAMLWAMTTVVCRIAAKLDATSAELERIRQKIAEFEPTAATEPPQG